jgi:tetratricopeptide (TPR) repeat protein
MMGCARPWAPALGALGLVLLLAGCGTSRQAGAAVDAGRRATEQGDLRGALEHYRMATRLAPDSTTAQLALGEAADALGEFDEALSAYQAAARRAPSTRTWLRLGEMADRMGQVDLALQSLEQAYGPWREHATLGLKVGVVMLAACVPKHWPSVSELWTVCLPSSARIGRAWFRTSREMAPQYAFRVMVEAGRREQAIALARSRGWLREHGDYCAPSDFPVSGETAGLLAMILQPDRADCLALLGERLADDGLARLGRLVLLDRSQRSGSPEIKAQAEWTLRYRLPDHEVPKLAESLNVTGYRLQSRGNKSAEALTVYTKAIAADPAFSWPYNNMGRLYMSQKDDAQALIWLTKALEVNPNHLRAQFNLGVASARLGRHDEAFAAYTRVLTMNPTDANAHANVGWLLLKVGRQTEGLRELQVAVNLEPSLDQERRFLDAQFGRDARQAPTPFSVR